MQKTERESEREKNTINAGVHENNLQHGTQKDKTVSLMRQPLKTFKVVTMAALKPAR